MRYDDLDIDSVFSEFARIAQKSGLMKKKANYTMPTDSLFKEAHGLEIDISSELNKIAEDELGSKDILDVAHPEGSRSLTGIDAKDDLAVVEDLKGLKERMLKVVNKEMKAKANRIATEVVKLANELDDAGLTIMANKFDKIAELLVYAQEEHPINSIKEVESAVNNVIESLVPHLDKLSSSDKSAFEKGRSDIRALLDSAKAAGDNMDFNTADTKLQDAKNKLEDLWYFAGDITSYGDKEAYDKALENIQDYPFVTATFEEKSSLPSEEINFEGTEIKGTPSVHAKGMAAVQMAFNDIMEKLNRPERVIENANPSDKDTYDSLKSVLNLYPGRDYRNWDQMLKKVKDRGQEMLEDSAFYFDFVDYEDL